MLKLNRTWISLFIIVSAVFIALFVLINKSSQSQVVRTIEPLTVDTKILEPQNRIFTIDTQGVVSATNQTQLMAEISGVIASISPRFQVGSFFHKDEVLFALDPLEYQATVKQAQAVVAEKQALLVEELAKAKQARAQWKNVSNATDLALRKPFVARSRALVQSAKAKLERALQILSHTKIKAPYDGIVTKKVVGLGQYVNPGSILGEIVSVVETEVRLPIKDKYFGMLDYSELSPEHKAKGCQLSAHLSFKYKGKSQSRQAEICRSEAVVDTRSRVHYLVATINDPYLLYVKDLSTSTLMAPLKIGTFVTVKLASKEYKNVFAIPRALLRDNNQILMVDTENKIRFKTVEYFHADNEFIYVNNGFVPGDKISLNYLDMPVDGMQVLVRDLLQDD